MLLAIAAPSVLAVGRLQSEQPQPQLPQQPKQQKISPPVTPQSAKPQPAKPQPQPQPKPQPQPQPQPKPQPQRQPQPQQQAQPKAVLQLQPDSAGGPAQGQDENGKSGGDSNVLDLVPLSAYPGAVCNDGSPAGYYWSASSSGQTGKWLIYLMGGMWCYSQQTCQLRMQDAQFQTSSKHWQKQLQIGQGTGGVGGIFSNQGANPFADYNKVYLEYCSSDAWMADIDASEQTWGLAFKGQTIVQSALADLAANHGLASGADVVFGGCSAGGRGAMVLLDYVAGWLPSGVNVRGILDSGLWVDIPSFDTNEITLQEQTQDAFALFNPTNVIPAECAAQYSGGDSWKCIYGQYRMPFVQTPYFINAAQMDDFQLLYDMGGTMPETPDQVAYADQFQAATLAALQPSIKAKQGVFSVTCLVHCLTLDTQLMDQYTANGQTMVQALTEWEAGSVPQVVSSCQGYPCVEQCPGGQSIYGITAALQNSSPQAMQQAKAGQSKQQSALMGMGTALPQGQQQRQHFQTSAATSWMLQGRRMV